MLGILYNNEIIEIKGGGNQRYFYPNLKSIPLFRDFSLFAVNRVF